MNSTQLLENHIDTSSMEELELLEQTNDYLYQQLMEDYLDYLQDNHIHPDIGLTPKSFNEWIKTTTISDDMYLPF
tara:strand:+ start:200 stop:424 length:225 start_codon:yes stop_codon:yes gene_type:complete